METSKFAQRLAANEQPKRDRAIKKLRKYIAAKTAKTGGGFSVEELLQLWKGLHYCFWMQDKPLLQEELSAKLCGLLKAFPDADSALVFAAAFFLTQAREWGRLDQWRMDKYMMLIRDFLHATLEVVKGKQWETSLIGSVSAMVGEVMDARKEEFPDGLRLHLADIYLEEVEKVGAEELTGDQINVLLDPFLQYVANSKRDVIANKIIAKIFGPILQASSTDHQRCEESGEESTGPRLQFNYSGLQQMMFDAGRQKNILPKVRRKLYRLVKRFSDAATEGTQSAVQHGKRKRTGILTTGEEAEAPKEKKMKKEDEDVKEDSEECPVPSEQNHVERPVTASPHRKNKHRKKHMDQETPQSASKHVAFDLDRNSSRGLQEFVISTVSSSSPFLPTRSPSHGILKESPGVTPLAGKETTKGASRKGHKRLKKEKTSSSKEHSAVWHKKEKLVAEKTTSSKGKKLFKFHSKKKEKTMKKPKHR